MIRIAAISDTHLAPAGAAEESWHSRFEFETAYDRLADAISASEEGNAEMLVVTGDLAQLGDDPTIYDLVERLASSGSTALLVPGNHDLLRTPDAVDRAVHRAGRGRVEVANPMWQPIRGDIFIAGAGLVRSDVGYVVAGPQALNGHDARLAIWVTHFPVHSRSERFAQLGLAYAGDADNQQEVEAQVHALAHGVLVLSGHLHARDVVVKAGVLEVSLAASIEAPFEFALVDIDPGDAGLTVTVDRTPLMPSVTKKLPVLSPALQRFRLESGASWSEELTEEPAQS